MKNNQIVIISIIGVVLAGAGLATYAVYQGQTTTPTMEGMNHSNTPMSADTSGESDTYKKYSALTGEDYDKAFVANMIVHHESAMNMAEKAGPAAKHTEIQDLSMNITSSQGREVNNMMDWQKKWGYPATSGHNMTDMENASGSIEDMAMMSDELEGLTGDAFDKKFLELMITHHQGAINMAKPAATNAFHQEVKDLAIAIIAAQTKEIEQMKQWQMEWGYVTS